ncbi:Mom family adenine methylcarbamoylation protein [Streptomyces tauricus]
MAVFGPQKEPYTESLACSRFVLLEQCPANSESWFLARCHAGLLATGVRGAVSFADPVPRRTASGTLITPGHCGWIYQATNGVYSGRATARTIKILPDGTVFHDRAAQKVRRQEQGHEYAEAQLIALGAPVPRAGCNRSVWLREALVAAGARNVRHRGAHRFCGRFSRVAAWSMTVSG